MPALPQPAIMTAVVRKQSAGQSVCCMYLINQKSKGYDRGKMISNWLAMVTIGDFIGIAGLFIGLPLIIWSYIPVWQKRETQPDKWKYFFGMTLVLIGISSFFFFDSWVGSLAEP